MTLNELLDKRAQLITEQEDILDTVHDDKRPELTGEESETFDRIGEDLDKVEADIARVKKFEGRKTSLTDSPDEPIKPEPKDAPEDVRTVASDEYKEAFNAYLRARPGEVAEAAAKLEHIVREARDLSATTDGSGGYTVPEGFQRELIKSLKEFGGVREACRVLSTPTGNDIPWPGIDDVGNTGELLAENTEAAEQDPTFRSITLKAYKYSSKLVQVPIELLQDSAFDVEGEILRPALAERIGRITNTHFTTGDNSAKPQGIVPASVAGATAASATSVGYDDLVDLEHSVDPRYRKEPGAGWMFADGILKILKKLKDSTGQPIWNSGIAGGAPSTILDYPYTINQDMDGSPASSDKSVLFGSLRRYIVRDVMDFQLYRLNERFITAGQVGFLAFSRHDGRATFAEATFVPVKHLVH